MPGSLEVFRVALRLGLTSFGGPSAHIGYFRTEYVQRRRWLTERGFAELVAIAQFLPGPSSSQLGVAVGFIRAGWAGAVAAWLGFTLPSAVAMAAFAGVSSRIDVTGALWLHALKLVAVAVVLDAVLAMARTLTRTPLTIGIAAVAGVVSLLLPTTGPTQLAVLTGAGLVAAMAARGHLPARDDDAPRIAISRRVGVVLLTAFVVLSAVVLIATVLPGRAAAGTHRLADLAAAMFRAGALVFGGGHVVLPLLQTETVPRLVAPDAFLAGYGAAQAVPGPLFTFAAFVGQSAAGVPGAVVATVMIFLPGMLLMFGVLPFWSSIRSRTAVRSALIGVNAAVVGLLASALVDPIATGSVHSAFDLAYTAILFALLRRGRRQPVVVVAVALVASPLLGLG
jgi:chromate transporter